MNETRCSICTMKRAECPALNSKTKNEDREYICSAMIKATLASEGKDYE